ncbi:MAG: hypothetical protein ACI9MC_002630 [Kiritimatiellia bacterium]|jgi:hypothetical protein
MSNSSTPGDSVVHRLARRSQGGLYRREVKGGGEVYSGPTASRALRALGARAMTMDSTIFVAEDFNESSAHDRALYAHERHHQMTSGGAGAADTHHDDEELAARAIERMVIHRSEAGEDFGSIMRDVTDSRIQREADVDTLTPAVGNKAALPDDPAAQAYMALRSQGRDHESVVRELADYCVQSIAEGQTTAALSGRSVGFL